MPPIKRKKKIRLRQKKALSTPSPETKTPSFDYLYPTLDDTNFNIKIAEKREFNETQYEGGVYPIEEHANKLCNAEFELSPHQMFVRNFLSFQTPYNSLLLYHGLGSGKTCSAIGISEDMRDYLKHMDINQRIIVVASPNVQDNFKLQLFDDRKLKLIDGLWNIRACTGNKYLKEINPMNMKGLSREKVMRRVRGIINASYIFFGYVEFANYINKKSLVESDVGEERKRKMMKMRLQRHFANRLIIIDEIHNIRVSDENKNKRVASALQKLVDAVPYMRLLFLSATPMFNSHKEIIWLINIMNKNDRRSITSIKDVFHSDGSFRLSNTGEEIGKALLERKATGYVSFVRGENPYTFPYRIWPNEFATEHTYASFPYPEVQLNLGPIIQNIERIAVYLNKIGTYQSKGYEYIIKELIGEKPGERDSDHEKTLLTLEKIDSLGYTLLQKPIEALNIIYPSEDLDYIFSEKVLGEDSEKVLKGGVDVKSIVGKSGLDRIIKYSISGTPATRRNAEYKSDSYGRIFSPTEIGKYSGKIAEICERILNSTGVVLVYSQYIDGGLVPIALALEEMGFRRAGKMNSLFKTPPTNEIDAITSKPRTIGDQFVPAKYAMITGDKSLSPNNISEIKQLTSDNNLNGEKVRVVLISQAGSEGLDLKFIRQVHILDPWYNMNRIEQIIGRAVRTCSHKDLPFIKRNVEIYLHGTVLDNEREEAADLYVYRLAEQKSIRIGEVSRVLKRSAIDCLLNTKQVEFTPEILKQTVKQELASGKIIDYQVGDKPYTAICDYMESCQYTCKPYKDIRDVKLDTYSEEFITMNTEKIVRRIRMLFKDKFFYTKNMLVKHINAVHIYPLVQINAALNQLIYDNYEYITDKYSRIGNLINIGELYLFQPLELTNNLISSFHRSTPIAFKPDKLVFKIEKQVSPEIQEQKTATPQTFTSKTAKKNTELLWVTMVRDFEKSITEQHILRGEKDWFILASSVIILMEKLHVDKNMLHQFIVEHILESLLYEDTLTVLHELDNNTLKSTLLLTKFKHIAREYYKKNVLHAKNILGLFIYDNRNKKPILLVKNIDKEEITSWRIGEKEDEEDLKIALGKVLNKVLPMKDKLGTFAGYMALIKNQYYIFKVKDTSMPRHKGARCDQAGKKEASTILQKILTIIDVRIDVSTLHQLQICILQEFYLRLLDNNFIQKKKWFLTPTEVLFAIQ